MYEIMNKLISKRYYATREESQTKVDVFYATNRLTDTEYTNLCTLISEIYGKALV